MRIFVGIGLPPGHRAEFARVQSLLRPCLGDFRWVRPEAAHLTLHFIGEIAPEELPGLQSGLDLTAFETPCFDVNIGGLGTFPERGRVRAVWLGVADPLERLRSLAARVAGAAGADPSGPYRPHITLGRPRRGNRSDVRAALASADVRGEPAVLSVTRFALIRSHLTQKGARYETLASYRLKSG